MTSLKAVYWENDVSKKNYQSLSTGERKGRNHFLEKHRSMEETIYRPFDFFLFFLLIRDEVPRGL